MCTTSKQVSKRADDGMHEWLQPVRGKKTKAAKAKAKYADQDEEDKQLAMQFLASAGKQAALTATTCCGVHVCSISASSCCGCDASAQSIIGDTCSYGHACEVGVCIILIISLKYG